MLKKCLFPLALIVGICRCAPTLFQHNEIYSNKPQYGLADKTFLDKFDEIWGMVVSKHINNLPNTPEAKRECLLKTLSGGLPKCLNDPYTMFFTSGDWQDYEDQADGIYGGVGLDLDIYNSRVIILATINGTPAGKSGAFNSGDIIEKVNGENITGENLNEVVAKITGPVGTQVIITVRREGKILPDIKLIRSKVSIPAVESAEISDEIYYIKANLFTSRFLEEFYRAFVVALADKNHVINTNNPRRSVIIDLRNNPGGLLIALKYVSYFFAPSP